MEYSGGDKMKLDGSGNLDIGNVIVLKTTNREG